MEYNKEIGLEGEHAFIQLLNTSGIPYDYVDDWCDFLIYDLPVDVKSCRLSQKFTNRHCKKQQYKIGRFQLTDEQQENVVYLALFVRNNTDYLFLGIMKTSKASPKYISIHKTREHKLYTLTEFVTYAKRKQRRTTK